MQRPRGLTRPGLHQPTRLGPQPPRRKPVLTIVTPAPRSKNDSTECRPTLHKKLRSVRKLGILPPRAQRRPIEIEILHEDRALADCPR